MKHPLLLIVAIFVMVCANMAFAVRVNTIYQAEVAVSSQSDEERNKALLPALTQVLVKASGNARILDNPKIKPQLAIAGALEQEFSYSNGSPGNKPYLLVLQFDPEGVNKILRDSSAPLWGANRPLVLAWVEYEEPDRVAEIIDTNSQNTILKFMKQRANERGLPLLFPLMDVTDINKVPVNDIVSMDTLNLVNAAKRYASDAVLIARVFKLTDGYSTDALLLSGETQWNWKIKEKTMADVLNKLIDNMTDVLAGRYASIVTHTVQEKMVLKITGIDQEDDFEKMMNYVQHLPPVTTVQIDRILGDTVMVSISLRGTRDSFEKIVTVGKKLTPVANAPGDKQLVYQWNH